MIAIWQGFTPNKVDIEEQKWPGVAKEVDSIFCAHGFAEVAIDWEWERGIMRRVLVVGAGFFGLTMAERIANDGGAEVLLLDRRNHIGGNAWSQFDSKTGIEVHKYGIHIFHTSNLEVWRYAQQFTAFNNYRHHVWTTYQGKPFPMPISLATINQFFGRSFSPDEAKRFLLEDGATKTIPGPDNLEDKAIASIGRQLYVAFIRGYTKKQWQTDPRVLPPETIARLPVRFDLNTRYFNDLYEGQPLGGYMAWHEQMLQNPRIKVELEVDYLANRDKYESYDLTVYSGPLDEFFEYRFGNLNWRTLDFEDEIVDVDDYQGCSQMNFADEEVPWTRILEYKHLHPERKSREGKTLITREYSRRAEIGDEVYYPVNAKEDRQKVLRYRKQANALDRVIFGGRLATYKYLDMHMAIGSALSIYRNDVKPALVGGASFIV